MSTFKASLAVTDTKLFNAIIERRKAWFLQPITADKFVYFFDLMREEHGVELDLNPHRSSSVRGERVTIKKIVDEKKYAMFILSWV